MVVKEIFIEHRKEIEVFVNDQYLHLSSRFTVDAFSRWLRLRDLRQEIRLIVRTQRGR